MKKLIENGQFTPCVTNSWANSRCLIKINDCEHKFRSTWEAMFWLLTRLPYEKIRIPYINEKQEKCNYIVDFHDDVSKILYEIKPKRTQNNIRNVLKEKYAKIWCENNNYQYIIIDENWLKKHKKELKLLTCNEKILEALEKL